MFILYRVVGNLEPVPGDMGYEVGCHLHTMDNLDIIRDQLITHGIGLGKETARVQEGNPLCTARNHLFYTTFSQKDLFSTPRCVNQDFEL